MRRITNRDKQILRLRFKGLSAQEVGDRLGISRGYVYEVLSKIFSIYTQRINYETSLKEQITSLEEQVGNLEEQVGNLKCEIWKLTHGTSEVEKELRDERDQLLMEISKIKAWEAWKQKYRPCSYEQRLERNRAPRRYDLD